jgi:hypothetical protein
VEIETDALAGTRRKFEGVQVTELKLPSDRNIVNSMGSSDKPCRVAIRTCHG